MKFNTAISALMILLNEAEKQSSISVEFYETLIKLLAPFAPHLAEELFQEISSLRSGSKENEFRSVHSMLWPKYNLRYLKDDTLEVVIQVNGKMRDTLIISSDATRDEIEIKALQSENIKKYLEGKKPTRIIYVPEKLLNFVIEIEE